MPEPGSFAGSVLHERHPALIERVRGSFPFGPAENEALDGLRHEVTEGAVRVPDAWGDPDGRTDDDAGDGWRKWVREHLGERLDRTPFLFAESYFYRRLLDTTGFHRPGPWWGVDPFGPMKAAELADDSLGSDLAWYEGLDDAAPAERRSAMLSAALWGNRADLGFQMSVALGSGSASASGAGPIADSVLVDDSAALWSLVDESVAPHVVLVADNAGRELIPDLLLIDHLLRSNSQATLDLHVKPSPYFVSDATPADVIAGLRWLATVGDRRLSEAAARLKAAFTAGRLSMVAHPFACAPLSYHAMPADLAGRFSATTVTVLKGDLNYRRLVGDLHWPPTTPFEAVTAYFPSPVVALRTLKSDVAVGLGAAQVDALAQADASWRTAGTYAVVHARL